MIRSPEPEGDVDQPTAILEIAADRFLAGRFHAARDVFAALARGLDPRAPSRVVCIRQGTMFDVELPRADLGHSPTFVARLFRAEHVVGLEEHLDVGPATSEAMSLIADPDDIAVRLWACEAWIEYRSEVHVSERYVSFPRALNWEEIALTPEVRDRYLFDYEAAFARHGLSDEQVTTILEHKGCRVTALDLDRELDHWIEQTGLNGPDLGPYFGPSAS